MLSNEVLDFMNTIGLEINSKNSATNDSYTSVHVTEFENADTYKYQGIEETLIKELTAKTIK